MERFRSILDVAHRFDVFLFDLFGVLWDGDALYDGVPWTLEQLKRQDKKIILLSNNTGIGKKNEAEYEKRGLIKNVHYDEFITSGDAAREILKKRPTFKYYTIGLPNESLFNGLPHQSVDSMAKADLVYIGVVQKEDGRRPTPGDLSLFMPELEEAKRLGKTLFCANPDYTAIGEGQKVYVTQGGLGRAYEEMGGNVEWCGKPYSGIFEYALERLGGSHDRTRMCMVGDTLRTDIKGANDSGIVSVLTKDSGITNLHMAEEGISLEEFIKKSGIEPDIIIDRVGPEFGLHPNLQKKDFILNLPLCMVLLEDNSFYPWLFLVPRRDGVVNMLDLGEEEYSLYNRERRLCAQIMTEMFGGYLNAADIALLTPQMHHHVVIRKEKDPAFPGVVWGHAAKEPYTPEDRLDMVTKIRDAILGRITL